MVLGAGTIDVFQPARFETLYDVVHAVVTTPEAASATWYLDVERQRDALATLGRPRPKSEAERRDISQGIIKLEGQTQQLNADFVAQTLLLSDELNVSETYAASLLQEGIAASTQWARLPLEVACLLYYRERLALLAALKELVRGTYTLSVGGDIQTGLRVGRLLDELVQAQVLHVLLQELDVLRDERVRIQASLQRGGGAPRLSDEMQLQRQAWVEQALQELGQVLYLLALARRVAPDACMAMLAWLAKATLPAPPQTAVPLYVLTAVLATLDSEPDDAGEWLAQHATSACVYTSAALGADAAFLARVKDALTPRWACEGLRRVVQLQWALLASDALATGAALGAAALAADEVQAVAHEAITADDDAAALVFLLLQVVGFRRGADDEVDEAPPLVDDAFQVYVLQQVEHLVHGLTTALLPLVRKLQRAEEDAAAASHRGARPGAALPVRRYDIEALLDLVALLCRGRPEANWPLWESYDRRTSRFLPWAIDVREPGQQRALLQMLAALAEGERGAAHTHALLEHEAAGADRRLVSWARLFEWLGHYVDAYQRHAPGAAALVMPPDEMVLLRAFLQVLATVVQYSATARDALLISKTYAPVDRLLDLYLCAVPVDLKAALLQALAALASARDGAAGERVRAAVWDRFELHGVVRRREPAAAELPRALAELQHVEAVHGRYPGTQRLVELLTELVPRGSPAADAAALVAHASTAAPFVSTPAAAPERPWAAYVAYVLDDVFLPASTRPYARAAERWSLSVSCLAFAERCVAALAQTSWASADALAAHPGYAVVRRLLGGGALLQELLFFVHPDPACAGYEVVQPGRAPAPAFADAVRLALRLLLHTLELQTRVLETLLPSLSAALAQDRATLVPLERHLLQVPASVVQLALYVNASDATLGFLAVQLLRALAHTPTFQASDAFGPLRARTSMNRLVGVLDMAGEAGRVAAGALAWLEADPEDDVLGELSAADAATPAMVQAALLDLMLELTVAGAPAPSLAHVLLGFDMQAPAADRLVDHTRGGVLDAVRTRIETPGRWPLGLATRCYALLRQLCVHSYTSAATLRTLRAHDFAARQLPRLGVWTPADAPAHPGTLVWAGGETAATTPGTAVAWLGVQAHVLAIAALELHTLVTHDQLTRATPLLLALVGESATLGRGAPSGRWRPSLEALRVHWRDPQADGAPGWPGRLAAARTDDASSVYSLAAVAALLLEERRHARDPAAWLEHARSALWWAAAHNSMARVGYARYEALAAWRQLLDVVVAEALPALQAEVRVPWLLDVAAALLPWLDEDDAVAAELAAATVLQALEAVRREARQAGPARRAPSDRVLGVLRALVDALSRAASATARRDVALGLVAVLRLADGDALDARARSLLVPHAERVVDVLARDALDGADVTQTVALTALAHLAGLDTTTPRLHVAETLRRRGYLASLVRRLQELDAPLQAALAPDPPSLNAQYVYEALMALLSRLAATEPHALVDSRVLDVLARVNFPAWRPETARAADADGFLPPVQERFASFLTPLLQLGVQLLTHAPAAAPARAWLEAHQDTYLAVLQAPLLAAPSLADVEQAALLVLALTHVAADRTRAPPTTLATATLALAATYLAPHAHELLEPRTPSEKEDAALLAPTLHGLVQFEGDARLTLFDVEARRVVDQLAHALVRYLEQASRPGAPGARAVLGPSLHVARVADADTARGARAVAAPSLGVALAAWHTQWTSLAAAVQSLVRVDAALREPDSVHADEWADIAYELGQGSVSTAACHAAAAAAVQRAADALRASIQRKVDMVEHWLVLLARHIQYFARAEDGRAPYDVAAFQAEAHAVLAPALDERAAAQTLAAPLVPHAPERVAFVVLSARRVTELLLAADVA